MIAAEFEKARRALVYARSQRCDQILTRDVLAVTTPEQRVALLREDPVYAGLDLADRALIEVEVASRLRAA